MNLRYVFCFLAAGACFALARWTLDIDQIRACRLLAGRGDAVPPAGKRLQPGALWPAAAGLGVYGGAVMWRILDRAQDVTTALALTIVLLCLLGSACVDFVEHRIPNLFPGVLAALAVALLAWSFFSGQPGAMGYVVSALISCAGSAIALLVVSALSGGGIGAGDIKLISALGLMCGVEVLCRTLLFGMIACALAACVLLAAKKKTRKEGIPFAPFLLVGYGAGLWITLI